MNLPITDGNINAEPSALHQGSPERASEDRLIAGLLALSPEQLSFVGSEIERLERAGRA